MSERCDPPLCRRPIGHRGRCTSSWSHREPVCGVWMPYVKEECARRPGHRWEHRSAYALDNDRDGYRP